MDCDTTGVEPDFALMKFKKLAGGGYMKIANQSIGPALHALGYKSNEVDEIINYVIGSMSLDNSPYINKDSLMEKGFSEEDVSNIEAATHNLCTNAQISLQLPYGGAPTLSLIHI